MLMHISAFVRDFDYKFRHFLVFLPLSWVGNLRPSLPSVLHYSKRQTAPSNLIAVPQVTSFQERISIVQPTLDHLSSSGSLKVKAPICDGYIFLLICEAILGRRPVYPLNDQPSDLPFWCHFNRNLVDLIRQRRRNAPQYHISRRQRLDVRRPRQSAQLFLQPCLT